MPVIKVYGLPNTLGRPEFRGVIDDLRLKLVNAALSISVLGLVESDVTVFMPSDLQTSADVKEIVIEVIEFWIKPERTPEVRKEFAKILAETVSNAFPRARAACLICPFDPEQGLWVA